MKIVFCTHDGQNIINGVNTWLLRLLPLLEKKGITTQLIATADVPEEQCTIIPLLKSMGIKCTILKTKRYTEREIKWILEYVNRESPDIFVANNMYQAWYASKWMQQAGVPVIGVLHSDNGESEERIKSFAVGKNGYTIAGIVAVSDVLFKKANRYNSSSIIKKIPCGINVSTVKSSYEEGQTFRMAYVGRLEIDPKNIDEITRAFCETIKAVPGTEAYMYGDGCDAEIVRNIINEHGCTGKVMLKGNISNEQLISELSDMQVITLMSDYEGLPVSLIEAMSVGVVPICKHIPSGIPELLIEGFNGYYIENTNDFAERVAYLKNNPEVWESLSINAKSHVKQKYSIEECVDQWCELFKELATSKKMQVKIPYKLELPPVNKGVSVNDNREPGLYLKLRNRLKRTFN